MSDTVEITLEIPHGRICTKDRVFNLVCFFQETAQPTKTSFEDARCKCVCPKFHEKENSSLTEKTVFISANADPNKWYASIILNTCF